MVFTRTNEARMSVSRKRDITPPTGGGEQGCGQQHLPTAGWRLAPCAYIHICLHSYLLSGKARHFSLPVPSLSVCFVQVPRNSIHIQEVLQRIVIVSTKRRGHVCEKS